MASVRTESVRLVFRDIFCTPPVENESYPTVGIARGNLSRLLLAIHTSHLIYCSLGNTGRVNDRYGK